MTEKNVKPGWRKVKFGDVVRQCKEKADPETSGLERYVAGEHMDTDDLRIRRWGEIGSGYLGPAFHMRFRPGQVLYGSRRTYLRKVAVADFDGICANTTFVLEPKNSEELLPEFLPFLMQTDPFNEFSIKNSKGSVNPYINFSDLARFEFALPPLAEQQKALNMLSSFDASMEALADVSTARDTMIRAFIQERFEYFDEHCDHRPASELMRNITVGIVVKPADLYVPAGSGVLALRSLNLFPDRFVLDETVEISKSGHAEHHKSQLSTGDIVVVRTGRPGDSAVISPELDGINCVDLIVAKPGDTVDSSYVTTFLNSNFGRRIFLSGTTGTAQKHFNVGEFSKLRLPVPELSVQRQFVSALTELRSCTKSIEQRLASAKCVRRQLLEQVFGG